MAPTGTAGAALLFTGESIIVLEDEYFLATDVARALTAAGAEVIGPFPTVEEAFAEVDAGRTVDGALLDVNLRGEMVFPLAEALRQRGVLIVFMTGYDRASLPLAFRDVPIFDKPVNIHQVARVLATARRYDDAGPQAGPP